MANPMRGTLITQLRLILASSKQDQRSDEQLLNQFIATRDEQSFTILVARHGRRVWDICQENLDNVSDAEDAFQRTFMLLAQRAAQITRHKSLRAWLLGAARRESWTVNRTSLRQTLLLKKAGASGRELAEDATFPLMQEEIAGVLRQEVAGLPESLRVPLVQRYLENKTLNEIAFLLGCSDRAVAKRLLRGEALLRKRLTRRGMSAGCVGLAALLGSGSIKAAAAVSPRLMENTIRAALFAPMTAGGLGNIPVLCGRLLTSRLGLGLVVLVGLLITGGVYGLMRWQAPAAPASEFPQVASLTPNTTPPPDQNPGAPNAAVQEPEPSHATVSINGQVVDTSGKEITDARITFLGMASIDAGRRFLHDSPIAESDTDSAGRFRLNVPTDFPTELPGIGFVSMMVYAPGHGLATAHFSLFSVSNISQISMDVEKPIRGRVLNPQGQPAAGVRVAVVRVGSVLCQDATDPKAKMPPHWPEAAITDDDGRFVINGLGRKEFVILSTIDNRYGVENVAIAPGQEAPAVVQMRPVRFMPGRLRGADTLKPLAGVQVLLRSSSGSGELSFAKWSAVTDEEGRFRVPFEAGYSWCLEFSVPDGMPYLTTIQPCSRDVDPDKEVDFTLPEAVRVTGRVTDSTTHKPIANVAIIYFPSREDNPAWRPYMKHGKCNVVTDSDGHFSVNVCRGAGHLLMHAQQDDYRVVTSDEGLLLYGLKSGVIRRAHAIVPIDGRGSGPSPDLKIELRRGVSIKARILQPDGQPVNGGFVICRRRVWPFGKEMRPIIVSPQGTFNLDGCEPEQADRIIYLDPISRLGATIDLIPTATSSETITINAKHCGQACVTLVDGEGNPLPDVTMKLMVCLPDPSAVLGQFGPSATIMGPSLRLPQFVTDMHGQVQVPTILVPGAVYRIMDKTERLIVSEPFQVSPEEKLELKVQVRKARE